jgi:hypothetical protein
MDNEMATKKTKAWGELLAIADTYDLYVVRDPGDDVVDLACEMIEQIKINEDELAEAKQRLVALITKIAVTHGNHEDVSKPEATSDIDGIAREVRPKSRSIN